MFKLPLLPTLALGLALCAGAAAPPKTPPAAPPLCLVKAAYFPVSWPIWADPDTRLRRIVVELRESCPEGGEARISLHNLASGRALPEQGTYRLTPQRPTLTVPYPPGSGVMPTWEVRWHAASGKTYPVPQAPRGAQ